MEPQPDAQRLNYWVKGETAMKQTMVVCCMGLSMAMASAALADRGSIPYKPHVKVFEPNQRVMIAWNGREEILLLSTDLRASAETKVLEVLPLPSEPKVKKGSLKTFTTATQIINRHLRARRERYALGRGGPKAADKGPAGEVTFHKRIGPHEISVTRVLDGSRFVTWVEKYLNKQGVERVVISPQFRAIVEGYIRDRFQWFVFDVVDLGPSVKTIEPIQYRFRTDYLFYPLRITMLDQGHTTIDLIVLTPRLLRRFPGLGVERVRLMHDPIRISAAELRSISEEMYEMLGRRSNMALRIWQCTGSLASFDRDLIARE